MYYIETKSTDPCWNLAQEQYVFDTLPRDHSYFILWQNIDTVVIGRYQNALAEINTDAMAAGGLTLVRRLSGGGAVYHDLGNLNYTFITNDAGLGDFNFSHFTQPVIRTLARFGITAQFNGRNDLTIDGRKFSGNAQYSKNGRVMHHGTLLFNSDLSRIANVLTVTPDKLQTKGVASVRSRVGNITDALTTPITLDQFKTALIDEVGADQPLIPYNLTPGDKQAIATIRDNRYATWDWTYGQSPAYTIHKHRRYPFGAIDAYLTVSHGCITDAQLYGDFFSQDLPKLQSLLIGLSLNPQNLGNTLCDAALVGTIDGLTANDLMDLLLC